MMIKDQFDSKSRQETFFVEENGHKAEEAQMPPIRVLIADDHPVIRATIRDFLASIPDIAVVGEAANGVEALHFAIEIIPDVLLLDMEMPGLRGFEIARQLKAINSPVRVLALSVYEDWQYIKGVLDHGAAGYLLKGEKTEVILDAIRGVARGEKGWFSQRVIQKIAIISGQKSELALVKWEQEILKLVVEGQTNQEISQKLGLTEAVVKTYLATMFAKLGVDSRVTAAIQAVRNGLV
jgi:DNA-binding NarL/FixJ family response regulator